MRILKGISAALVVLAVIATVCVLFPNVTNGQGPGPIISTPFPLTDLTTTGLYTNTGNITVTALATPSVTSVTPQTAGGGKTCTYKVVALVSDTTHTAASGATSTADCANDLTAANHGNVLVFTSSPGNTGGTAIYRTVFSGATPAGAAATGLIATVGAGITTYTDAGANGDASVPPTANTTGALAFSSGGAGSYSVSTTAGGGVRITRTDTSQNVISIFTANPADATSGIWPTIDNTYVSGRSNFRWAAINTVNAALDGTITTYASIATVESGVPASHWNKTLTAQGANIAATDFVPAISSAGAARYRLTCYIAVTRQATTTATVPDCNLICTDPTDSVVKTIQVVPAIAGVAANPTTAVGSSGSGMCDAKVGTAIQWSTTNYASSGGTSMQYKIYLILEEM